MQYISPFSILGIDIEEIIQKPDSINISFLRKKLLAEFELNNSITIKTPAGELSKNDVLVVLDQLQNADIFNFHIQITKDPILLDFLQYGALEGVFIKNQLYNDADFLKFISPYFAHSYCSLVIFILENEGGANPNLYRIPILITPSEKLSLLQPIRRKILDLVSEIEKNTSLITDNKRLPPQIDEQLFGYNIIRILNILDYSIFEHDVEAYVNASIELLNACITDSAKRFHNGELVHFILKRLEMLQMSDENAEIVKHYLSFFQEQPKVEESSGESIVKAISFIIIVIVLMQIVPKCNRGDTPNYRSSLNNMITEAADTTSDTDSIKHRRVFNYLKFGFVGIYKFGIKNPTSRHQSFRTGDNPYPALSCLDISTKDKANSIKVVNRTDRDLVSILNTGVGNAFVYITSHDSVFIGINTSSADVIFMAGRNWDANSKLVKVIWPGEKTYHKDIYGAFTEVPVNFFTLLSVTKIRFLTKAEKTSKQLRKMPEFSFFNKGDSIKMNEFLPHKILEEDARIESTVEINN